MGEGRVCIDCKYFEYDSMIIDGICKIHDEYKSVGTAEDACEDFEEEAQ